MSTAQRLINQYERRSVLKVKNQMFPVIVDASTVLMFENIFPDLVLNQKPLDIRSNAFPLGYQGMWIHLVWVYMAVIWLLWYFNLFYKIRWSLLTWIEEGISDQLNVSIQFILLPKGKSSWKNKFWRKVCTVFMTFMSVFMREWVVEGPKKAI